MRENKMYLQFKDEGDTEWSILNTAELGERGKWKAELEEKIRGWRATQYPNAQFRIVSKQDAK